MTTENPDKVPSDREKFNRTMGLSAYAGSLVMVGLVVFGIYDAMSMHGIEGLKKSLGTIGLFVAAAVILAAIGYTTGKRKPPAAQP